MHEEKKQTKKEEAKVPEGAVPAYLMDRCVSIGVVCVLCVVVCVCVCLCVVCVGMN